MRPDKLVDVKVFLIADSIFGINLILNNEHLPGVPLPLAAIKLRTRIEGYYLTNVGHLKHLLAIERLLSFDYAWQIN